MRSGRIVVALLGRERKGPGGVVADEVGAGRLRGPLLEVVVIADEGRVQVPLPLSVRHGAPAPAVVRVKAPAAGAALVVRALRCSC